MMQCSQVWLTFSICAPAFRGFTSVDFASGAAVVKMAELDDKLVAHAWLVFIGWGVGVPVAVFVARRMKVALGYPGQGGY